ncbi:MAG: NAD(P)/FAD-dependent oxidoreductase [Spirochaetaceae bacterium]
MNSEPRIVVVGGGFAGSQAVRTLVQKLPGANITLIDTNQYATMLPALPDVLSGRVRRDSIVVPFTDIYGTTVRIVAERVTSIDFSERVVHLATDSHAYDFLVLANGSVPAFFGFQPEAGRLHTMDSYQAATALRTELEQRLSETKVGQECTLLVVGGGYTGLEVAACAREGFSEVKERFRVVVVERAPEILGPMPDRVRRRVTKYLEKAGVSVVTGTSLESLSGSTATLSDGTRVDNVVVCWSAGMRAATPDTPAELPTARDGRILTEETLAMPGYPEVFVAGDAAQLRKKDVPVRRAVNFAYYSGRRAAENVAAMVKGRKPKAFKPVDLGWVIPLGGTSSGTVFGFIPVAGRFGLRLHYIMSGFRHFSGRAASEFYKAAFHLARRVDPPAVAE